MGRRRRRFFVCCFFWSPVASWWCDAVLFLCSPGSYLAALREEECFLSWAVREVFLFLTVIGAYSLLLLKSLPFLRMGGGMHVCHHH